jgi:hypothetical protein
VSPRLVLVAGLQKSGTTLMARLLKETGLVGAPWVGEGDEFWGNTPAFAPDGHPAGTVYQRDGGARGHEITADDANHDVRRLLHDRLDALDDGAHAWIVNKNPYNVARLGWLRALFPDALVVAMIRDPVANVFSLLKKHHAGDGPRDGRRVDPSEGRRVGPSEGQRVGPSDGWWGVKPAGWEQHADRPVLERCAWQWAAVNALLARDRAVVDAVVPYAALCANPTAIVEGLLATRLASPLPPLRCFDDEFRIGGMLRSRNWGRLEAHEPAGDRRPDIAALDDASVATIVEICERVAVRFPELDPSVTR